MSVAAGTLDGAQPRPVEGQPPRSPKGHRPDIQGLRAVAVLMVVLFHAGLPFPGGFVGVDVFFVISGFVITAMLMREHQTHGRIRLWRFYVRRFKRLIPALAVTVSVVMLASLLLLTPLGGQQAAAKTGLGAMLLASNIMIARTTGGYFDGPAEFNPLLNMWSLSVEEQFYVVFPAVMVVGWLVARRTGHARIVLTALVAGMGVISIALAMAGAFDVASPVIPDSLVGFYGPATRVWEFAAGALLALAGTKLAVTTPRRALGAGTLGAAMVIASLWLIGATTPFPGPWTLLPVVGTMLLIVAGTADTPIRAALSSRPMVAIGDRSYSIYLWHWPFIVFAHIIWSPSPVVLTAAALVSLIAAYASYRWIEQPIRGLSTERGLPLLRLIAAATIPPVALAGFLLVAANNHMWSPTFKHYGAWITPSHAGTAAGCNLVGWKNPEKCTWNAGAPGAPIYLVGDSNADHFSEALIGAAESLERSLVVLTAGGCAYLPPLPTTSPDGRDTSCDEFTRGASEYLADADPGLVVLSNSSWQYLFGGRVSLIYSTGAKPTSVDQKLSAFASGLTDTVTPLQSAGHTVMLVQTVPSWGYQDDLSWQTCSTLRLRADGCREVMAVSETPYHQRELAEVVAAVASTTGAQLLDTSPHICPDDVCRTILPDKAIPYSDGTHITVPMSEQLAGVFADTIRSFTR